MSTLRHRLLHLAHANPSLRPHLLPLLASPPQGGLTSGVVGRQADGAVSVQRVQRLTGPQVTECVLAMVAASRLKIFAWRPDGRNTVAHGDVEIPVGAASLLASAWVETTLDRNWTRALVTLFHIPVSPSGNNDTSRVLGSINLAPDGSARWTLVSFGPYHDNGAVAP